MNVPKCQVCDSPMWLDVQDEEYGQSQRWHCTNRENHGLFQQIPKKWWGITIFMYKQRGWRHP